MKRLKPETIALPFDVAVACGYVSDRPVSRWKARWNRFRLWICPGRPPRAKIAPIPDDPVDMGALRGKGPSRLREDVARYGISKTATLYKALAEVDRVLNQNEAENGKYWHDYDAAHPHLHTAKQRKPLLNKVVGDFKVCRRQLPDGCVRYSIGREDIDDRRYWTGIETNEFVTEQEGEIMQIWETESVSKAETRLKQMTRRSAQDIFERMKKVLGERKPFQQHVMLRPDCGLVEIYLEDVSCYAEWIKGEGGDIAILRANDNERVVGAVLPLRKFTGNFLLLNENDEHPMSELRKSADKRPAQSKTSQKAPPV